MKDSTFAKAGACDRRAEPRKRPGPWRGRVLTRPYPASQCDYSHFDFISVLAAGQTVIEQLFEVQIVFDGQPIMAEATARRQQWSADLDLRSQFGPEGPRTAEEMVEAVALTPSAQERIFTGTKP